MIDEDVLRGLLADAAESVPAPGGAPDALFEAIASGDTLAVARRRPRGRVLLAAAAALVVIVAGFSYFSDGDQLPGPSRARSPRAQVASDGVAPDTGYLYDGPSTTVTVPPGASSAGSAAGAGSTGSASGSGGTPAPALPPQDFSAGPQTDTAKVIRTGSIDLEVPKRGFEATVERITSMVVGVGGYVAESTTTESDDAPHGSITLRIPADSFDQLVIELRKLGEVKSVTSKGTDVTAQFTDLFARLSALSATHDRLLEVLRGARNVGDIIAVQDRITGVQTEIEQLQGQQRLLEDQTSYGTLAITLGEPGADRVEIAPEPDDGLGKAWDEARRRFGDSIEGIVSWSGSAAVWLLVLAVLGVLARLAWTRGKRYLV